MMVEQNFPKTIANNNCAAQILVVDDQTSNLRLLGKVLTERGYKVKRVREGNFAIQVAKQNPPDLILLEIMMPSPDGYEICSQLKADERTRDVPIIFLSVKDDVFDKVKAFSLGAADYISKPFEFEEVLARIENQLKISWIQKNLTDQNAHLLQEIEERQRIEVQLSNSEKLNRSILRSAPIGICLTDENGYFLEANPAYCQLYGFTSSELIGQSFTIHFPQLNHRAKLALIQEYQDFIKERGNYQHGELTVYKKDNSALFVESTRGVFQQDDGRFCVVTTVKDISDRKRTELELRVVTERFQYLLTTTPAVIFSCQPSENYQMTFVSENITASFGYEAREFLEDASFWPSHIHPEDTERIFSQLPKLFESGQHSHEFRFLHQDGTYRWVYAELRLVKDAVGNPIEIVGYSIDITDRKQAEIALQQQLKREQLVSFIQERIRSSLDLEEILTTAVNEVRQFLLTDRVLIYRIWPNGTGSVVTESVESGYPAILGQTFPEEVFPLEPRQQYSQGRIFYIEDVDQAEISSCLADFIRQFGVRAKLVVPILKDGELWGLLIAHHCRACRQWHSSEIESLKQITVQLAIAIQQAALYEQAKAEIAERKKAEVALRESAEREKALAAAIQRIRQSLDIETIFAATTEELCQVIDCDRVAIYRFNPDWTGEFVAESMARQSQSFSLLEQQKDCLQINLNEELSEECCITTLLNSPNAWQHTSLSETQVIGERLDNISLVVEDIYNAGYSPCYLERLEQFQIKAYIIVPILWGSKLWGLLAVYQNSGSRQWKQSEVNIVIEIGNQLGIALQQSELLAQTKRQSEALQKAVLVADAANRAKSDFLAAMSHELRTPLNAILGFTQVMSLDGSLSQNHQESLAIINRAGEHLLTLINDILELSKIEAGKTTLDLTRFDLIVLLDSLEKMLQLKVLSKGLQLIFQYSPDLPHYIQTDAGKLRQVLLNLLGNAIKFTEQGSVTLRVKAEAVKNDSQAISTIQQYRIIFEVEDTGLGIASEEIPLLFEAFGQTVSGRESQEGSGLGLPISRKYVQMMGGNIRVSSTPNVGSLFTFDIQATLGEETDSEAQSSEDKKVIGLAPNQQNYRILVVDDTLDSRLLMSQFLKPIGFEIREASNGFEALEIWENWQPHLIFMDMRMPVMDGYEATKQIRAKEQDKGRLQDNLALSLTKTVIIALTASAFEEQRKIILSVGCDDLVCKPFSLKNCLEKIGQYLRVQYVYEQENDPEKTTQNLEQINDYDLENYFLEMSPDWVKSIYNAATLCSDDMIIDLLQEIPPEKDTLAIVLNDLAMNFRFEEIIEMTEKFINESEVSE